jgi:hypothetical protein
MLGNARMQDLTPVEPDAEIIEYLGTGKILAKDAQDEDVMFATPGPAAEYWEGEQ